MGDFIATMCIISAFEGVTGGSAGTLADAHVFFFHCYILYKQYKSSIIICTNSVQTHAQTHQGFPTQGRHDDLHPSVAAELNHLLSEFFWKLGNCIFFLHSSFGKVQKYCTVLSAAGTEGSTAPYSVQQVLKEEEPPSISRLPPSPPAGSRGQRPFLICD